MNNTSATKSLASYMFSTLKIARKYGILLLKSKWHATLLCGYKNVNLIICWGQITITRSICYFRKMKHLLGLFRILLSPMGFEKLIWAWTQTPRPWDGLREFF